MTNCLGDYCYVLTSSPVKLIDSLPGDSYRLSSDDFWLNNVEIQEEHNASSLPRDIFRLSTRICYKELLRGSSDCLATG